jgi:hypothetical protein
LSSKDKDKFDRIYCVGPDGYKIKAPEEAAKEESKEEKLLTPPKPKEERKKN